MNGFPGKYYVNTPSSLPDVALERDIIMLLSLLCAQIHWTSKKEASN